MRRFWTRTIAAIVISAAIVVSSPAAAGPADSPRAGAVLVGEAPRVDGVLDDPAWAEAVPVTAFLQRDPHSGEPATERTEVRIVYTMHAIYFGIRCHDARPDLLVGTERRRDQDLTKDDSVAILLDTFHDHRNAFLFRTNVLGTEFDAMVTDEGRNINTAWDEKWEVATRVDEEGWTAEFRIPFNTLRMGREEPMVWGLEIERLIRRKNEAVYWANSSRDFSFETVSRAGHLTGLRNLALQERWRVKPFLLGGFEQIPGAGRVRTSNLSALGLEVLKFRPTPAMTLDLTYNTDFAQTAVDDLVTNIDRFPLFFPERREFFLEGAGIFEFGTGVGVGGTRDLNLFFSRRIGLSSEGVPVPIVGGAKLAGRAGPYTVGAINMQTDSFGTLRGSNFGVLRVKRDVLGRSSIGGLFTNRQSAASGDHNRVIGLDGHFVFARNLNVNSFLARSETPGVTRDQWTGFARVRWDSDFLMAGGEHLTIQRNFQADVGWVPRPDQKRTSVEFGIRPRPADSDLIRQWIVRTRLDLIQNQAGQRESMTYHFFTLEGLFQSGDHFQVDFHRNFERLFEPFRIRPDITIPVGRYPGWDVLAYWSGAPHRRIAGPQMVRYRYEGGFFEGHRHELRLQPQVKLSEPLSIDLGYALDAVALPGGEFSSHVVNSRINYAFSTRWLTSATAQYSNVRQLVNFRFRLNYIYRPGNDIFFIYNEGRNVDGLREGFLGRSIMVKSTYSFDF